MIEVTFTNVIENITSSEHLYQWDEEQVLSIKGVTYRNKPAVHFANKNSKMALVIEPTITSNSITASIPNSLLREPYPIIAYLYSFDDGNKTIKTVCIPVVPRTKPDNYVFVDDEGLLTLQAINAKVNDKLREIDDAIAELESTNCLKPTDIVQNLETADTTKIPSAQAVKNYVESKPTILRGMGEPSESIGKNGDVYFELEEGE